MFQTLAIKRMKHSMPCAVRHTRGPIRLATFSILEGLTTQGSLINRTLLRAAKGHTVVFQFDDCRHGFARHVVDCVLVAEPVGTFDGIVHVPAPVVPVHVCEGGVDAALGGDGVGAGGEELGYTCGFEASFGEA